MPKLQIETAAEQSVTVTENFEGPAVTGASFDAWYEEQAKRIRAHLASMNRSADKAEQHRTSALQILKSVEKKLTVDGKLDAIRFDLFKAKVCPELSTSQAYVKLAILTGKLSVEDHRKKQNTRQVKSRKNKKARQEAAKAATTTAIMSDSTIAQVRATGSADHELTTEQAKARMAALDGDAPPIVPELEPQPAKGGIVLSERSQARIDKLTLSFLDGKTTPEVVKHVCDDFAVKLAAMLPEDASDDALTCFKTVVAAFCPFLVDVGEARKYLSNEKLWRKKPKLEKAA